LQKRLNGKSQLMKSVLSLFSGIGGLCHHGISAAGLSHKFRVQQFVEISPYSQSNYAMNNQKFQSTQILPTTIATDDNSTFCVGDSPVAAPVTLEIKKDSTTPGLDCGAKCSASSTSVDQQSLSSKTQQGYSLEEWQQSSKTFPKSGTYVNGKLYPRTASACHMKEKESLSLPTPMAYSTVNSQPPEQTKLEIRLRKYGSLMKTEALNPAFVRWLLGFPLE
jgi:hypothetical protein